MDKPLPPRRPLAPAYRDEESIVEILYLEKGNFVSQSALTYTGSTELTPQLFADFAATKKEMVKFDFKPNGYPPRAVVYTRIPAAELEAIRAENKRLETDYNERLCQYKSDNEDYTLALSKYRAWKADQDYRVLLAKTEEFVE